jgi:hypothetical protein
MAPPGGRPTVLTPTSRGFDRALAAAASSQEAAQDTARTMGDSDAAVSLHTLQPQPRGSYDTYPNAESYPGHLSQRSTLVDWDDDELAARDAGGGDHDARGAIWGDEAETVAAVSTEPRGRGAPRSHEGGGGAAVDAWERRDERRRVRVTAAGDHAAALRSPSAYVPWETRMRRWRQWLDVHTEPFLVGMTGAFAFNYAALLLIFFGVDGLWRCENGPTPRKP